TTSWGRWNERRRTAVAPGTGDPPRARRPRAQHGRRSHRRHHACGRRRRPRLRRPARAAGLGGHARARGGGRRMIHVYAFAEHLGALPAVDGLDGAPLERIDVDGVAAVFSRRTGTSEAAARREHAIVHGNVIEAIAAAAETVL